jgi:hypothetical protein
VKKFFFASLWLAFLALAAAKYPPNLQWREIGRGVFTIIFPADRWQQAEAALAGAEIRAGSASYSTTAPTRPTVLPPFSLSTWSGSTWLSRRPIRIWPAAAAGSTWSWPTN